MRFGLGHSLLNPLCPSPKTKKKFENFLKTIRLWRKKKRNTSANTAYLVAAFPKASAQIPRTRDFSYTRTLSEIIKSFYPATGGILFWAIFYFFTKTPFDRLRDTPQCLALGTQSANRYSRVWIAKRQRGGGHTHMLGIWVATERPDAA